MMATEINAGENYEYSDLFNGEPSGRTRQLVTGVEVDDYHNIINFHGNRNAALEFIEEIKSHIPFDVSVTVNFDDSTNLKSAYIDDEILNLKVKDINFERDGKYIDDSFKSVYETSIEDDKREVLVLCTGIYTITTKEHAVNKEDIEFLVDTAQKERISGLFTSEPEKQYFKLPIKNKATQIV